MSSRVVELDLHRYLVEMRRLGLIQEKRDDYAVLCPVCKEEKWAAGEAGYANLKLWIHKGEEYGHCFRCGTVFVDSSPICGTGVKNLEPPVNIDALEVMKLGNEGYWTLDRFQEFDEYDAAGVEYLVGRLYLYREMYKALGIRFRRGDPVIPFQYRDETIYYQVRITDPNSRIKYFSPPIVHKPPYILESGKPGKKWVVCEGVFDAVACRFLYPEHSAFALLGSDITPYQVAILRKFVPREIVVYMDRTDISRRVERDLARYIGYADIQVRESSGQDPEEHLREQLLYTNDAM